MNDKGYINIQGWQINQLGLRGNKLILYALVYGFSQDGKTEFKGSYTYVMKALGLSKATVQRLYSELIQENLIKKTKESHYIALVPKGGTQNDTPPTKGVLKMSTEGTQNEYNIVLKMNTNNNTNNTLNNNIAEQSSAEEKSIESPINSEIQQEAKILNTQVAEIIKEFEEVNPTCKTYYGNKTQRKACEDMISIYGFDKVIQIVRILPQSNNTSMISKITTPSQLLHGYAKLKSQLISYKNNRASKGKAIISS